MNSHCKAKLIAFWMTLVLCSGLGGIGAVTAAFKVEWLGWIVDGPGWLVSRFMPIDLHEGDGAAGFLLAILLSWLWTSMLIFAVLWLVSRARFSQVPDLPLT